MTKKGNTFSANTLLPSTQDERQNKLSYAICCILTSFLENSCAAIFVKFKTELKLSNINNSQLQGYCVQYYERISRT